MSIFFKKWVSKDVAGRLMMSMVEKYNINSTSESEISLEVSPVLGESNQRWMTHINHKEKAVWWSDTLHTRLDLNRSFFEQNAFLLHDQSTFFGSSVRSSSLTRLWYIIALLTVVVRLYFVKTIMKKCFAPRCSLCCFCLFVYFILFLANLRWRNAQLCLLMQVRPHSACC